MKIAALLSGFLLSHNVWAWQSPRQAIEEFLEFELAGGRTVSWQFDKYLAVGSDYDEPGWDELELIQDARVLSLVCAKQRCTVEVEFTFAPTERLKLTQITQHPKGGNQVVKYKIIKTKGQWLLKAANGAPRISHAAFKRLYPDGL